jgi:hypothetical protein
LHNDTPPSKFYNKKKINSIEKIKNTVNIEQQKAFNSVFQKKTNVKASIKKKHI